MPSPFGPAGRRGRLGWIASRPGAIAATVVVGLCGAYLAAWLLAPGLTPDEATRILQLHLTNQANARMREDVRAAGLPRPDRPRLQQLSDELARIRDIRVRRVHVRPEFFWSFSRRSSCIARMELDGPPAGTSAVRYFRTVCASMTASRIQWETTAARYRFPL